MTMTKNPTTGNWEADIKDRMAGRVHVSLRTKIKTVATLRYSALVSFLREGDTVLIQRLRDQKIHVSAIERCVRDRVPFATLRGTGDRWPTVDDAADAYIAWLDGNQNKADGTTEAATFQLARFREFKRVRSEGAAETRMGDVRLDEITTEDITAFQVYLNTVANDGKPYALNTQTPTVSRITTLYLWHLEEEERRAMQDKRSPRVLHCPVDPRTQPKGHTSRQRWLRQDEAARVFAATPDQLLFPVAVGLLAGLRVSEMLFLQPTDIDMDAGLIDVKEKEWTQGGKRKKWRPKTKRSARKVPMNDDLRAIVERHAARYASPLWMVPSLTNSERPMPEAQFGLRFNRILTDAGLEPGKATPQSVSFHTLRHTFASWLVMADENALTVAKLLGNTLAMVEDTYGHLAPQHRMRAVRRLNGMVPVPPPLTPDSGNGHADA
jgi:integrase